MALPIVAAVAARVLPVAIPAIARATPGVQNYIQRGTLGEDVKRGVNLAKRAWEGVSSFDPVRKLKKLF